MKSPSFQAARRTEQHEWRRNLGCFLFAVAVWLVAARAEAGVFPVTAPGDGGGPGTLRSQIAAALLAGPGNTVAFSSLLTVTSIGLQTGELAINKDLTIQGPGATNMLVFNNSGRVFHITSSATVTISGLTLTGTLVGGKGADGTFGSPDGHPGDSVRGGAISNENNCTLTLSQCVFTNCTAIAGNGGDAYPNEESLSMPGMGGTGGLASGGALANDGDCQIVGCTFVNNSAQGGAGGKGHDGDVGGAGGEGDGGAVEIEYDASVLSVINSTFNGNIPIGGAGGLGGDAFIHTMGAAPGGMGGNGGNAAGGGIYVTKGCPNADCDGVLHCTISGNQCAPGFGGFGGLGINGGANGANGANGLADGCGLFFSNGGFLPVGNSIIAGNFGSAGFTAFGPDVGGPSPNAAMITSKTNNLIGLTDGSMGWVPLDLQGSIATGLLNPVLGPLQINQGQTPTMAPLPCSPAIDAGTAQSQLIDQAGQPRTVVVYAIVNGGDGTDIGAYELQAFPTVPLNIAQANGNITLSWPAPDASCFILQKTASLAPPNWMDANLPVNLMGNQNQVVIPQPVNGNLFFRLRHP